MNPEVRIETKDPDLGRTVLLWLSDLVKVAHETFPQTAIVFTDDDKMGRPYARSKEFEDFGVHHDKENRVIYVFSSSSVTHFERKEGIEFIRKVMQKVKLARDVCSLDHFQVIRHQQRIRAIFKSLLGLEKPEEKSRVLMRVDDYPTAYADSKRFLEFHAIAREYQVPYLLGVTPFLQRLDEPESLSNEEIEILQRCTEQGVEVAQHGFTHERRYANYPSELISMHSTELREQLDKSERYFRENNISAIGFIAPFNSYEPLTLSKLTKRFPLICGGPESVRNLGYKASPIYLMGSLYIPSYRYAYYTDQHAELSHLDALIYESKGSVLPISVHWADEIKHNLRYFHKLCQKISSHAVTWKSVLREASEVNSWVS